MNEFHRMLRDQIVNDEGIIDMYNMNFKDWPTEDGEGLDLENYRFVELTDDRFVMIAGGDWQEGAQLTIQLVEGELRVTDVSDKFSEGIDMDEEDVIEILNNSK